MKPLAKVKIATENPIVTELMGASPAVRRPPARAVSPFSSGAIRIFVISALATGPGGVPIGPLVSV